MTEVWLPVPELECSYEVSDFGRVRSLDRLIRRGDGHFFKKGRTLKPQTAGKGYLSVEVGGTRWYVHRLVLNSFVGPCPPGMEVCHNNGCRTDNRLENLRYDSPTNNNRDKSVHGTDHNAKKTHCPQGHEYTDENTRHQTTGGRQCRTCVNERRRQDMRERLATPEGRASHAANMREWRRRTGRVDGLGNQWARRTHCTNGHEFTPENTYTRTDGGRRCRVCMTAKRTP